MLKKSEKIYRTLKGVRYEHITSDPSEFEALKQECKTDGAKYRIINKGTEFLKEVK